jgi:hypothetical protein
MEVSGDIVSAATTLGGLVLVFLAATFASYESMPGTLRDKTVRKRFRRRAWFGFAGFAFALLAALLALFAKWLHHELYAVWRSFCLRSRCFGCS